MAIKSLATTNLTELNKNNNNSLFSYRIIYEKCQLCTKQNIKQILCLKLYVDDGRLERRELYLLLVLNGFELCVCVCACV